MRNKKEKVRWGGVRRGRTSKRNELHIRIKINFLVVDLRDIFDS